MQTGSMIFGTDGVRDRAGEGLLAPSSLRRLVRATVTTLRERGGFGDEFPPDGGREVWIGRDTRESGPRLLGIVADEFRSLGVPVRDLGVLPTPGVAWAAVSSPDCGLAVVLSASHNPWAYNGVKLLTPSGSKVSEEFERAVSERYHDLAEPATPTSAAPPAPAPMLEASAETLDGYVEFLVRQCERRDRLTGRRVLIDAANGAAFEAAPRLFRALGMDVECLGTEPDGRNINEGCGALHPEVLAARVQEAGASIGFCFDGDADRMIPVTGSGRVLDGDFVLALAARHYLARGQLPERTVVATVMSNVGLEKALGSIGVRLLRTPVGDRNVYREMVEGGHPIGGEQSGHLIFLDAFRTGDGLLAAVRLLDVLEADDLDLEREARIMTKFPQVLKNVRVREKVELEALPAVVEAVREAETRLGESGRVLLRYSGTEPLARVMLEGPESELIETLCDRICEVIRTELPV